MTRIFFVFIWFFSFYGFAKEPIVTVEKLLEYKRECGLLGDFKAPEVVLICYQKSTLECLLKAHPEFQRSLEFSSLYLRENSQIGILGGWGVGASGLSIKLEELIALGAKKFVAVGTAGSVLGHHNIGDIVICEKALAEDGVAHLYTSEVEVPASSFLIKAWKYFERAKHYPPLNSCMSWSFSALFKESVEDLFRVESRGCSVVEMEAATLFAISNEKGVDALSLFVITDNLMDTGWILQFHNEDVRLKLHQLAEKALLFCESKYLKNLQTDTGTKTESLDPEVYPNLREKRISDRKSIK